MTLFQVKWHKDGRLIGTIGLANDKYIVSSAGSIFVNNVTLVDTGRYECSVKNEKGRVTASALITIK